MAGVNLVITGIRQYRGEPDRIHYLLESADGSSRDLYVDRKQIGLYRELEKHLPATVATR
jgi:hypothetical protein